MDNNVQDSSFCSRPWLGVRLAAQADGDEEERAAGADPGRRPAKLELGMSFKSQIPQIAGTIACRGKSLSPN